MLAAWLPFATEAHVVRPGYLEVRQVEAETFDVLWKVPARGEYRLRLHARLPRECRGAPIQGNFVGGAFVERWRAQCPGGLVGRTIDIEGLSATRTDVLARIEWSDGTTQAVRLTPELTRSRPGRHPARSRSPGPTSSSASSTSCSAAMMRDLLGCRLNGARRDAVLLNAAAALAAETGDFKSALEEAAASLESGRALAKLNALVEYSRSFQTLQ